MGITTQTRDFTHRQFQVLCIASPESGRWTCAAMLVMLDAIDYDDRPRWFSWDFRSAQEALAHAEECARDLIDSGEAYPTLIEPRMAG